MTDNVSAPGGWRRIIIAQGADQLEGWWRFVGARVHLESQSRVTTAVPAGPDFEAVAREMLLAAAVGRTGADECRSQEPERTDTRPPRTPWPRGALGGSARFLILAGLAMRLWPPRRASQDR